MDENKFKFISMIIPVKNSFKENSNKHNKKRPYGDFQTSSD